MIGKKAIRAMIVMAVSGVALSGAGLAQASTVQPAGARDAHAAPAVAGASRLTPAPHLRATAPTPRFVRGAAPNDTWSCYAPTGILSNANLQWVSAELAYWGDGYAMLRARSSSIGGWEQFTFCDDVTANYWVFYNDANGDFVSTELGYTGDNTAMLRARASSFGPWEEYSLYCTGSGATVIKSNANNDYVSTELGYGGSSYAMLRARAAQVGPWEQYSIPNVPC